MKSLLTFGVVFVTGAALALVAPHSFLSPGPLLPGHAQLEGDCLACHSAGRGVPVAKCVACHPVEKIGLPARPGREPQALSKLHQSIPEAQRDCLRCHAEHVGDATSPRFAHDLLEDSIRNACATCHGGVQPSDDRHRRAGDDCAACHRTGGWKPAFFDHAKIAGDKPCAECHASQKPADALHTDAGNECAACHDTTAWKPARFDHAKYFRLDRDHNAPCATCHPAPAGFKAYTCYGCHEHTPSNIAGEHEEEGIRDYQDCARCHRSADEHEAEHGGRGGGERERGGRENHDRRGHDDDD